MCSHNLVRVTHKVSDHYSSSTSPFVLQGQVLSTEADVSLLTYFGATRLDKLNPQSMHPSFCNVAPYGTVWTQVSHMLQCRSVSSHISCHKTTQTEILTAWIKWLQMLLQ
jgi:hypothetical protein